MAKDFRPDISPDDVDADQAENKKQLGNPERGSAHWPSKGKDEADNALSEKPLEKKSTIKAQRDERPGS